MAETGLETSNTTDAFNHTSDPFENIDFDALLQVFQDWENILRAEKIDFDEFSL